MTVRPISLSMTPQEIVLTLACMSEVRITDCMNHHRTERDKARSAVLAYINYVAAKR